MYYKIIIFDSDVVSVLVYISVIRYFDCVLW